MTTKIPVELSSTPSIVDNGDATAVTIDSSENVGMGTTSPAVELHIHDEGGLARIRLSGTASSADNFEFGQGTTGVTNGGFEIRDVDASATRFVIDSSGNVGLGTSSPAVSLDVNGAIRLMASGTDNDSHILYFANAACAIARDNNDLDLHAYDNMIFGVSNSSYPFSTERMRINSSGGVGINTTSVIGALTIQELSSQVMRSESTGSGTVTHLQFVKTSGGAAQIGAITGTTSSVSYTSGSDYRLKENVITDWDATTLLKQLKPSKFNFKDNQSETVTGFIAHEVQEVLPYLVNGEKDGEDMQSMDYAKLTPLLTKAIQELSAKVEELESKINE